MPNPNYDYLQQHPLIEIINVNWGIVGLGFQIVFEMVASPPIPDTTTAIFEEVSRFIFGGFRDDGTPRNVSLVGTAPVPAGALSFEPSATGAGIVPDSVEVSGSMKGAGTASVEIEAGGPPSAPVGRIEVQWSDFDLKDDDTEEIYHMAIWTPSLVFSITDALLILSFEFYLEGQDPYPDLP